MGLQTMRTRNYILGAGFFDQTEKYQTNDQILSKPFFI